eukprot:Clim_evm52s253 gene=Clim_evmTU52s253
MEEYVEHWAWDPVYTHTRRDAEVSEDSLFGIDGTIIYKVATALPVVVLCIAGFWRMVVAMRSTKQRPDLSAKPLYWVKLAMVGVQLVHAVLFSGELWLSSGIEDWYGILSFLGAAVVMVLMVVDHTINKVNNYAIQAYFLITFLMNLLVIGLRVSHTIDTPGLELIDMSTGLAIICVNMVLSGVRDHEKAHYIAIGDEDDEFEEHETDRHGWPEEDANFFSRITFWWMTDMIVLGHKRPLESGDLWSLSDDLKTENLQKKFMEHWERDLRKGKANVFRTILLGFGRQFYMAALFKACQDILAFVSPQLLKALITFAKDLNAPWYHGAMLAGMMFSTAMLQSVVLHQYFHRCFASGVKFRSAIISAIYEKSFKLSSKARQESTSGEIVNLMAVDAQRFMDLTTYVHMIWSAPLQIVFALYFLHDLLGWSVFAGVGVMLILMPFNTLIAYLSKKLQIKQMKWKDLRIRLMGEILNGIKVIKLYSWDEFFEEKVSDIRREEVAVLRKAAYLDSASTFSWSTAPFFVALCTFATYTLLGGDLTPDKAFVALSLFNLLQFPLNMLPMLITSLVQAQVAANRIGKFLKHDELDPDNVQKEAFQPGQPVLEVRRGTFSWGSEDDHVLKDINLNVKPGEIVAVIGSVGSGKSSLLNAILGDMIKVNGQVVQRGSLAYVPQQAWIQNATVQNNILFGKSYKQDEYERVLDSCALRDDLKILADGDQTEIGERGVNLSGGQKQRVSLARAVYQNMDLYLLDDPLSAVDVHVGKHLFKHVIGPKGVLNSAARILVSHQLWTLPKVDRVIVLRNGKIAMEGHYNELMENSKDFCDFINEYAEEHHEEEDENVPESDEENGSLIPIENGEAPDVDGSGKGTNGTHNPAKPVVGNGSTKGGLIEIEKQEVGSVDVGVYFSYLKALSRMGVFGILLFAICQQASQVMTNVWLSWWSNAVEVAKEHGEKASVRFWLGGYGFFGLAQSVFVVAAAITMSLTSLFAAIRLHRQMLHSVLRSPMSFFDTTPVGRIVNRFSKDIYVVDEAIPRTMRSFISTSLRVIGVIAVITYSTPLFIVAIAPLSVVYVVIQRYYVATSRQLQRLDSVSRSPVYAHFGETLGGLSVIRAFGMVSEFCHSSFEKVDFNAMAYFPNVSANRWLAVRLEFMGNLVILCAAGFAVIEREKLGPALVGLSISYALSVTQSLNWLVRMTSNMETNIIGVERIQEYSTLTPEAPRTMPNENDFFEADYAMLEDISATPRSSGRYRRLSRVSYTSQDELLSNDRATPQSTPRQNSARNLARRSSQSIILDGGPEQNALINGSQWPTEGRVVFREYAVRYRKGLDLVLKDINVHIEGGEKIGVCGRTGAGKSSLTLGLFRLIEPASGNIFIDGIDIAGMGLARLRSSLTIIPQDAFLFTGTVRENVDPTKAYSDAAIWRALESAHLKLYIESRPGGLESEVSESGDNLSMGQRQLLCLARALLRRTKILILDEATASIDMETDNLVQKIIREEFCDCTVITIAHRLNTILDNDR